MNYKMMEFELEGRNCCAMNVRVPFDEFLEQAAILLGKTKEDLRPHVQSQRVRYTWKIKPEGRVRDVELHEGRGFGIEDVWVIQYDK